MSSEIPQGAPTAQDIYAALQALKHEPHGTARSARIEELAETAELAGLDDALATSLLRLLDAYEFGFEPRKLPLAFARVLKLYDANPEAFDRNEVHSVYWCFKWVTAALLHVPEVPLATVRAWVDQMHQRYTAAGHGLHAVETGRFEIAEHTGADAAFRYECWSTRPRDEFSDCEACEARGRGSHLAGRGEIDKALAEWGPVLDGTNTCSVEPAATIAEALLPLVRAGRLDDAVSFHRSGYRQTRGRVGMAAEAGQHLEFAALTGNAPRGLELLAENRGRFEADSDPLNHLAFLTGVRVLMTRLVAGGAGDVAVPGPPGSEHTASSLLAELATRTEELAARFDARNGTTRVSDSLHARCAQEPLTESPLPLGFRNAPLAPPAAAASAPVRGTAVLEDFEALLAEAREASRLSRPDAGGLWDLVAQRLGDREPDALLRAELANQAAFAAAKRQSWTEVREQFERARALMDAAGEPGRALVAWSRALSALTMGDEPSMPWDGFEALRAAADALLAQERITGEHYCAALYGRVTTAAMLVMNRVQKGENPAEADVQRFYAEATATREAAVRLGVPDHTARVDTVRADVLAALGDPAAAIAALRSAISLLEAAERPWLLPRPLVDLAVLLLQAGPADEARGLIERALGLAARWPSDGFDAEGALYVLAEVCCQAEDFAAGARHFADAAAKFDRKRDARRAAYARVSLSQALREDGRLSDAVAVLESLLGDEAEAQLDAEARAQARLDLARSLARLGEHHAAAETFVWLADYTSTNGERAMHTMITCELASALARAKLWEQARAAADRALAAHSVAPVSAAVCHMLRTCANARSDVAEDAAVDEALEYLRRADEVNEATPESPRYRRWPETALNAQNRGQALAAVGRNKEALEAVEQSIAAWRLGGDRALEPLAEATRIAAVIEGYRLGLKQQARDRLGMVIARCRAQGLEEAARILHQLYDSLGAADAPGGGK